jgi:hypothetical protein
MNDIPEPSENVRSVLHQKVIGQFQFKKTTRKVEAPDFTQEDKGSRLSELLNLTNNTQNNHSSSNLNFKKIQGV